MSLDALGTSPLLSLIGWTVLSALTLGAAAVALALLVRAIAPRLAPTWGHRLVLSLYALSLAAAFGIAAMPRRPPTSPGLELALPIAGAVLPAPSAAPPPGLGIVRSRPSNVIADVVSVVGALSIGLAVFSGARLGAGLLTIRRMRRNAAPVTDTSVLAVIESVARRIGIQRRVILRESTEVDTAITGGWLRPFILLPPGLIEELRSEIEPVFAHAPTSAGMTSRSPSARQSRTPRRC